MVVQQLSVLVVVPLPRAARMFRCRGMSCGRPAVLPQPRQADRVAIFSLARVRSLVRVGALSNLGVVVPAEGLRHPQAAGLEVVPQHSLPDHRPPLSAVSTRVAVRRSSVTAAHRAVRAAVGHLQAVQPLVSGGVKGRSGIMIQSLRQLSYPRGLALAFVVGLIVLPSCTSPEPSGQRSFASPSDAAQALIDAARADNQAALISVLGPSADKLISSGDPVQDRTTRATFVAAYDAKHMLDPRGSDRVELMVGKEDWPLPIPIVQVGGRWHFDSAEGAEELINRRIGKNELLTIRTLLSGVEAQHEYFDRLKASEGHGTYAQKIISTPGQTDGLYWEVFEGEAASPLASLIDTAHDEEGYPGPEAAGGRPTPYHGYLFRILNAAGPNAMGGAKIYIVNGQLTRGFAFVAWPADYGSSGVVTFIVGPEGVVYQKDLGPDTTQTVSKVTRFDPDPSWARVDLQD